MTASRPTRISILASQLHAVGGIPRYVGWLALALGEIGPVKLVDLELDGTAAGRVRGGVRALAAVARRPDVLVLTHPSLWPVGLAARLLGAPTVVVAYGIEVWGARNPLLSWGLRRMSALWPVSSFTADQLRRRHGVRRLSQPLGGSIEPRFFATEPRPAEPFRILLVTRIENLSYKGVDVALAACEELAQRLPIELRIVGRGPDEDDLLAALEKTAAPVTWLGFLEDSELLQEYQQAGAVLLASRFREGPKPMGEGLGITLLEGAAAGVPGIGARQGGSIDTVIDGETGYLIEAGCVSALVTAVEQLLSVPDRRASMARSARAFARSNHSQIAFAARVRLACQEILGRPLPTDR